MPAKKLDELVRDLADPRGPVRARAAKRLIAHGNSHAVAPLLGLLEHTNKHVRCRAAEVLGELGDSSAFEPLVALLADQDHEVHRSAITALGVLGDARALPILVAELEREEQGLQRWTGPDGTTHIYTATFAAAPALARLGRGEAIPALLAMLMSTHGQMRLEAVQALGRLGGAAVFDQVAPMLADDERSVASVAAATLYAIDAERAVATLRAALKDERPGVRRAASELLTRVGDSNAAEAADLDELAQALHAESAALRLHAIGELGRRGGARAEELLRAATSDPDDHVRRAAWLMLAQIDPSQAITSGLAGLEEALMRLKLLAGGEVPVRIGIAGVRAEGTSSAGDAERLLAELRRELQSKDVQTRIAAATILGRLGGQEAVDALTEALDDAAAQVRRTVVLALATSGDSAAVRPSLIAALRDPEPVVRMAAARQLARAGDEQAIPILSELVKDSEEAAPALAELGDSGMQALTQLLATGDTLQRTRAATALGKINRPEAAAALRQALADDNAAVHGQAAYSLAELRDAAALPALLADLRDEHPEQREFAAAYLGLLGARAAIAPLIEALGDDAPNVRATAAAALGELGSHEALPQLMVLRRDDAVTSSGDAVAEAAREAIRQIRAKTKPQR